MTHVIYALVDEYGQPRYVGQTTKKLALRLSQHRSAWGGCSGYPMSEFFNTTLVTIVPLEVNPPDSDEAERRWIRQMREAGIPLFNISDGGRSRKTGVRHTDEAKMRISLAHAGKILAEEHRKKLSDAHTGVPLGAGHREAIGRGGRGLKRSAESRARLSASKTGDLNPMSAKQRAARAARELRGGDAL